MPAGAVVAAVTASIGVAGCAASARDFDEQAQRFIASDAELEDRYGVSFSDVECATPPSGAVGTMFRCSAAGDDDRDWRFDVTITGDATYDVTVAN